MSTNAHSLGRDLFRLAWPGALTLLLNNFYRVNDLYFVGKLDGSAALAGQAAVSVAGMVTILTFAFYEGLASGVLAMSARVHGAGTPFRARKILYVGLAIAVTLSIAIAALGLSSLAQLGEFLVQDRDGRDVASERTALTAYLAPIFGGGFFLCLSPIVSHAFLAKKDTRTPLLLELLAVSLNAGLNAILVLGGLGFEGMGVAGAGWATVGSRAVTSLLGLAILHRHLPQSGTPEPRTSATIARVLARVASPVVASMAVYSIAYQIVFRTTFAEFGSVGRAAFGCGFTLEGLAFCLIWGIAMASGSIVGNSLGAGRPDLASAVIRKSTWVVLTLTTPLAVLFYLSPGPLAALLTDSPAVRHEITVYLRVLAWSQFAVGLQQLWDSALCSSGHTLPTFYSTTFWNLARIPLCYLFGVTWRFGLPGVWWAINLSTYGKALTAGLVVRRGTWKNVEV